MKRAFCALIFALMVIGPLLVFGFRKDKAWLDESQSAFLPKELAAELSSYREFPVFWWNFVVLENQKTFNAKDIQNFCKEILNQNRERIRSLPCARDLKSLKPWLESWIEDLPRRQPPPADRELFSKFQMSMARASLPMSREVLDILRLDPLGSVSELQKMGKEKIRLPFENRDGAFFDVKSGRVLIAIQFAYPPNESKKTQAFLRSLPRGLGLALVGPHQSTYENETAVREDVEVVSLVGGILMTAIFIGLWWRGGARILLFIPPLILSTLTAFTLTVAVFGDVHGMVLAFGPGVIGLSMDYAIHAAFATGRSRQTWLANFLGVLTTMTVIMVGLFSELPILRQLMFFSGSGLLTGFLAFFALQMAVPTLFQASAFITALPVRKPFAWVTAVLGMATLVGIVLAKPKFQINELNFETEPTMRHQKWLYSEAKLKAPYLQVTSPEGSKKSPLKEAERASLWAKEAGIRVESVASFLPQPEVQLAHLGKWQEVLCNENQIVSADEKDFFASFFAKLKCGEPTAKELGGDDAVPMYLQDFKNEKSWLTLWFPATPEQVRELKEKFTDVTSLSETAEHFPQVLRKELIWMAPSTSLLSFVLLLFYYRNFIRAISALLPFFAGLGAYFIVAFFIPMKLSFITLIGFIMVFGFSLDYGIFATDADAESEDHRNEVRSALTLTTLMTLAGFVPLIFANHPAMKHLGQALVLGSIGTYIGALWGVSPFLKLTRRRGEALKNDPSIT